MTVEAQAHPEKRLFISLLTRDISLADAFLDLMDNSINAALKTLGLTEKSASEYIDLLRRESKPSFAIDISFNADHVSIKDNCSGINSEDARTKVFVFGATDDSHKDDRLSVYGIGLKRAMFKLGNHIEMVSDHINGGFILDLNVKNWQAKKEENWTFEIEERDQTHNVGTTISITELYEPVIARLINPTFETDLVSRIARAYSFFISRIISIRVNGTDVPREEARIGSSIAGDSFEIEGVSVAIEAGLGTPRNGDRYETEYAGWNIYCNGRAVIFYDKSPLTGWGVDGYLPSFQPKHRPFVGMVFFTSNDPEKLPWTTTKLGVNPDNNIWQKTVQRMADVGKQITRFLDSRYTDDGTTITMSELKDAIGDVITVQPVLTLQKTNFSPPHRRVSTTTAIKYSVEQKLLREVKLAIGRQAMSNGDVGVYTFMYFYENEVSDA